LFCKRQLSDWLDIACVKNDNSLNLLDGISVATISAKGEIRVTERDTWLAKMIREVRLLNVNWKRKKEK
jgi:hypothetical protein